MRTSIKAAVGVSAAGLLASVAFPAVANAETVGTVTVKSCNHTSKQEYIGFPYRNGLTSTIIPPGDCWKGSLRSRTPDEAVGYQKVNGHWLAVATKPLGRSGTIQFNF
ncbi:hypothetical protein [Streptomyces sp. NPDC048636]|uniref:hypothetical protein n=1 Tax=Streptomyces sp. NPDC048636 TaxID=3155762 RepID=UPI00343FF2E2